LAALNTENFVHQRNPEGVQASQLFISTVLPTYRGEATMSEPWFRGEGINVQPAKASGVENDIGDGMYLTDDPDVARWYAQDRAPNPIEQRVYSVRVVRAGMRVLDLTTDVRWRKMMNVPIPIQNADGSWNVHSGETFETT
jgi:hypothetical protein